MIWVIKETMSESVGTHYPKVRVNTVDVRLAKTHIDCVAPCIVKHIVLTCVYGKCLFVDHYTMTV